MKKDAKKFLFELLETPSPTGFESPGQKCWAGYVRKFSDSVDSDAYGTAWATVKGSDESAPVVMLESHADEIGYIVKYIDENGYIFIDRVGGSDAATGRGRRVRILGDKGEVSGVIGNTAIHIRDKKGGEKAPEIHELYVDVGAAKADEVEELGIRVGHPLVYKDSAEEFANGRIVSRALDNRVGGFIIAQALAQLAEERPAATVYGVNAVQEEIGGYGAKMVTHRLMPDIAVVLDVTHATDTPGIEKAKHGAVKLGAGPTVTHGTCNHPKVVERLMDVAKTSEIPLQHESSSRYSGTDTDQIYHVQQGIPSGLVSLPLRYMHSIIEVVDLKDVERVVDLLVGFVRSVSSKDKFAVEI
ncbi:MAG: M42 family metallopeptidase [Verrucomicrobiota bacterium]